MYLIVFIGYASISISTAAYSRPVILQRYIFAAYIDIGFGFAEFIGSEVRGNPVCIENIDTFCIFRAVS